MPNITIQVTRNFAVELHNTIQAMPAEQGQANYTAARSQVCEELLRVWPEAKRADCDFNPKETRPVELNPKYQRAIAEGFLGILNSKGCTGAIYANCKRVAGPGVEMEDDKGRLILADGCRLWGWVEFHATQKAIPDFDGELDGEPNLLDPESPIPG